MKTDKKNRNPEQLFERNGNEVSPAKTSVFLEGFIPRADANCRKFGATFAVKGGEEECRLPRFARNDKT